MQKHARSQRKALQREAWVDRDLSWLEFNRRVLDEARDLRHPLLERVKFLAIFSTKASLVSVNPHIQRDCHHRRMVDLLSSPR